MRIAVRGWSKATENSGNLNQVSQHPQKWDSQGVDKHNVCLPIPYPKRLLIKVHS